MLLCLSVSLVFATAQCTKIVSSTAESLGVKKGSCSLPIKKIKSRKEINTGDLWSPNRAIIWYLGSRGPLLGLFVSLMMQFENEHKGNFEDKEQI